jgi:hypothetical protein
MRGPILVARTTAVGDRKFVILGKFWKGYYFKSAHLLHNNMFKKMITPFCLWTLIPTVPSLPANKDETSICHT